MRRIWTWLAVLALAIGMAACGDDDDDEGGGDTGAPDREIVVSGASSLQSAFEEFGKKFGDVKFSFAGSDDLATQIRQGVEVDVFASANTTLPEELHKEGLVQKPIVFAGNRLVLAVPADSDAVQSLDDVAKPGVKVAIGSEGVPIGSYTRGILDKLPSAQRDGILDNVRSNEPDVKGIVGKLTQGAVDAGFVYITDVTATKGQLKAIDLPEDLDPTAAYAVAVVGTSDNTTRTQQFITSLLAGDGQKALEAAGFEPPPTG